MGTLPSLQFRPHAILAIWISLALILSPAAALAAPTASAQAQAAYQDPDGRFSLSVPEGFTEEAEITYEMVGDNPLNKLVTSAGYAFAEPETPNGVSVLFLLLDESITNWDDFAGFLAAFQTAAGGDVLPLVDLEFAAGDDLRAAGSAATRDRQLQIAIEAQDNVVAILTTSVERARYRQLRSALDAALDSFAWDSGTVLASLGGEAPPPPDEPAVDPTPEPEPEPESEPVEELPADQPSDLSKRAPDAALETERYTDPDGLFSLSVPVGLQPSVLTDADQVVHGVGFYAPDDGDIPTVAVAFTPAAYAAENTVGVPDFRPLDDELWNEFVDIFLLSDVEDMTVITDQRNDANRTAFLVLEADEPDPSTPDEMWVWAEESDGVGAAFLVFGDLDDPMNAEIFHNAVTTFAWSPAAAATATSALAGVFDPAAAPVPFDDPFGLINVATTPDYPLQAAYFDEESLEYTLGRNPADGVFQISISTPSDAAFNASAWSIIVDETEASVMETLSNGSLGGNAELIETTIGTPEAGADNAATILARTDAYWMLVSLLDRDGVLATEVVILPDSYWQVYSKVVESAVAQGVDFDPDAIRDAIEANQALGAAIIETGTANELPVRGAEIDWRYNFDPDDAFTVAVDFAQPGLEGTLKTIVVEDDIPDYPLAQYALWLGEEDHVSYGKMTSQETTGTRAAFSYTPDFPLNSGAYTAYIFYENELVGANGFTVEDIPPDGAEIANFGVSYGDGFNGEPLLVTTAIHPGDIVSLRGSVGMPAGSQLRLFWYDPEGWLDTGEVATIRLDGSYHTPYDWIYFDPMIDWQPGIYGYLLTVDGEPFVEGNLLVVEESAEVPLTADGQELFAALPLPADIETVPPADGFNLALLSSEDYPARDIISVIDAWLRMQGWQPALPSIGAPVAWDYRRWGKDEYQFLLQPGADGAENEIQMRYAPTNDATFGFVPSNDALDGENLAALAEVAQLDIEGLYANHTALSPDGNWLAVTTSDGTLYVFDALRLLDTIWWQPDAYYANPVFSPDGRDLAVTVQRQSRSEIQLFSNFDVIWLPTTRFNGHTGEITAIDYQSDGWLASGGLDGGLRQWEPAGEFLPVMVDTADPIASLVAAPEDAPGLLVAYEDGWLEYRLDDGDIPWSNVAALTQSPRLAVWSAFDENGVGDMAVYGEGQVEWFVYDTLEAELVGDVPADDVEFASTGAAFTPNGALLAISGDTINFFDRASGEWLDEWEVIVDEQRVPVTSLKMSPDGRYVMIVSDDGLTRLWAAAAE